MPRHPPCALHSLSHKYSTKTTRHLCRGSCDVLRRAESTSTQLQKTSRLSTIMRETEKIATPDSRLLGETLRRCSRPLFRDQGACPRGPATRGWTVPWGERARGSAIRRGLMSQDPTVCQDSALAHGALVPRLVPCRAEGAVLSDRSFERCHSSTIPLVSSTIGASLCWLTHSWPLTP